MRWRPRVTISVGVQTALAFSLYTLLLAATVVATGDTMLDVAGADQAATGRVQVLRLCVQTFFLCTAALLASLPLGMTFLRFITSTHSGALQRLERLAAGDLGAGGGCVDGKDTAARISRATDALRRALNTAMQSGQAQQRRAEAAERELDHLRRVADQERHCLLMALRSALGKASDHGALAPANDLPMRAPDPLWDVPVEVAGQPAQGLVDRLERGVMEPPLASVGRR